MRTSHLQTIDGFANGYGNDPHSLIASDRVEGTPVRRTNGEKIGTIERLMIDKLSGNVAYAVLSFGGFLGIGQQAPADPVGAAELRPHARRLSRST